MREAGKAFYFDRPAPPRLRLHLVRDEVIALSCRARYPAAKRLSNSLVQLIKRIEQQFGELPTGPMSRK